MSKGTIKKVAGPLVIAEGMRDANMFDVVRVSSARGNLLAKAIVTNRFQPMNANGKTVHMIGLPWHFGWLVPKRGGDSANLLTAAVGDPNSAIPESKAFMVNIEKMPDQDLPE